MKAIEKFQYIYQSSKIREIIRFGIVGVIATLIQFVVYYILSDLIHRNIALPISYVVSLCFNFFLTSFFTFKVKPSAKKGLGFLASHMTNFTLQFVFLNIFVYMGVPQRLALIPTLMVCVPLNFILVRLSMKRL